MRETGFYGRARTYYDLMSAAERDTLAHCLHRLEHDPSPDEMVTFAVPGVPGFFIYDDGVWRMSYTVPDEATIVIRSIAHALDLPG